MNGIHECTCTSCRTANGNGSKTLHGLMKLFFSGLNEEQKPQYLGLECFKRGPGSERTLAAIFGCQESIIRQARDLLLKGFPRAGKRAGGDPGRFPDLAEEAGGDSGNIVFSFPQAELDAAYQAKMSKRWFMGGKMGTGGRYGYPPGRDMK